MFPLTRGDSPAPGALAAAKTETAKGALGDPKEEGKGQLAKRATSAASGS